MNKKKAQQRKPRSGKELMSSLADSMTIDEILDNRLWGNGDFFISKVAEGLKDEPKRLHKRKGKN